MLMSRIPTPGRKEEKTNRGRLFRRLAAILGPYIFRELAAVIRAARRSVRVPVRGRYRPGSVLV
jgi:hypothetical protein